MFDVFTKPRTKRILNYINDGMKKVRTVKQIDWPQLCQ